MQKNEVLIVGAGPVGLTLAIDLGKRGIHCTLIEQKDAPQFLPKMERANARTMEMYRRIGLAEPIRKAGLRGDCPMDVYVVLSLNQPPLLRLRYPSVDEARANGRATNDGTEALEPYQLISQYTLEPLLKSIAETLPTVKLRFGTEFVSFEQDDGGVTTTVRSGGKLEAIRASYLVGCDGGTSPVRKQLGIKLRGEGAMMEFRQALFRCDELFDKLPRGNGPGHGRHYHVADNKASFLIMQDSTVHWTLHSVVESDEAMKTQFEKVVGFPVKYEMLSCFPWRQNLLLADRYQDKRVFIAGDAAHLVIPTGGLGMNTGVGDAFDLSWKLAATLRGWGGAKLLGAYEHERRQVGDRNIGASRYAATGRRKWRAMYRPNITENTIEGKQNRDNLAQVADTEQRKTNEMFGAEMGYRYVDSPIIMDIPGGPEHLFREYVPTTWPGVRLPHVWLNDGTPMQDHIPLEGYTLLRLGATRADTSSLEQAIRAYKAPLIVLNVPDQIARDIYGFDLILLRPDMHIVWRGQQLPEDVAQIAAVATGHGS
jgi:2-polyprenyl-6-methoxyphenol hydroxylase-like FAD-dependent oxidoreductase